MKKYRVHFRDSSISEVIAEKVRDRGDIVHFWLNGEVVAIVMLETVSFILKVE